MILAVTCGLALLLDQLSKYWVLHHLAQGRVIELLPPLLRLTYLENRGVAFGLGQALAPIFPFLALAICLFLLRYYIRNVEVKTKPRSIAFGLLIGGALGNILDRFLHGFVVDFIAFDFGFYRFPIFNLADSFVTLAIFFLLILLLRDWKRGPLKGKEEGDECSDRQ